MRIAKVPITDNNLRKAAIRLLGQQLVSNELAYVRKQLGVSATQKEIDDSVLAVRKLPWASIATAE